MRIVGTNWRVRNPFIRAAGPGAPSVPYPASPVVEILPPFGTNPPTGPVSSVATDLAARQIMSDPRDLWYLALPSKLTPTQVLNIMRSALGGDVWQQWQLLSLMLDTWPTLRKTSHEVRQAVAGAKYNVVAHVEKDGAQPTPSALDKRDTVRRAMRSFAPDPFSDEKGWYGMIYDLSDMMLNGISSQELIYKRDPEDGTWLPRAAAWVHPRHYSFGNDGRLTFFDAAYNRLNWMLANKPGPVPDARKFLVGQFQSRSGSSLGQGLVRPLGWAWSAVVFNREWMLSFAQRYGSPFLDATYKAGTPSDEVNKLNSFMAQGGANGWVSHVEGSTLTVHPSQSMGSDNAQVRLMDLADQWCMELILGQTATTRGTQGKLGQEGEREAVKNEVVQCVAEQVGIVLTQQFARNILLLNYGEDSELPTIRPDFAGTPDPGELAQRDQVLLTAGVPMDAEEFYDRHNLKKPEMGDLVIVGGKLGTLGDTESEIDPAPQPPVPGQLGDGEEEDFTQEDGETEARLRKALRVATDEDLADLQVLTSKAKAAPHVNGEWEQVVVKVKQIEEKNRLKL